MDDLCEDLIGVIGKFLDRCPLLNLLSIDHRYRDHLDLYMKRFVISKKRTALGLFGRLEQLVELINIDIEQNNELDLSNFVNLRHLSVDTENEYPCIIHTNSKIKRLFISDKIVIANELPMLKHLVFYGTVTPEGQVAKFMMQPLITLKILGAVNMELHIMDSINQLSLSLEEYNGILVLPSQLKLLRLYKGTFQIPIFPDTLTCF